MYVSPRTNVSLITLVLLIAIAALALAGPPSATPTSAGFASTYYVSATGSDSAPGTQSQPLRTAQQAANIAGAGDLVVIGPGQHAPFEVSQSGTAGAPITYRGSEGTWIDGDCDDAAIEINGDHVIVEDLGARRSSASVIRLDDASNVTLQRLTVTDWNCSGGGDQYRAGIASWGGGSALTVRDSYLERRVSESGSDTGGGNGIWVKNTGPGDGGGHEFSGNTIIGGYDGIGGEPEDSDWGVFNGDTLIADNVISDCDDDGIQVEGGTSNVRVSGNTISRCLIGIAFAPALGSPLTIMRNVITDAVERRGQGPAMFKAGDNSSGEVLIYHNTYFADGTDADGFKQTNSDMRNVHTLNNAIYAGRYIWETTSHSGDVSSDYNAIYTTDSGRFVKWDGDRYSSLSSLRSGTGQEMHSLTTPDFGWDAGLRPLAGSPLIDAGVVIPGINDGYSGAAPDIGAFESAGGSPPATTAPASPTPTPSPEPSPPPAPTATPVPPQAGDVDCDNVLTPADVMLMLKAAAGIVLNGCFDVADVNCDGGLDARDALIVLTHLNNPVGHLPAGCPVP